MRRANSMLALLVTLTLSAQLAEASAIASNAEWLPEVSDRDTVIVIPGTTDYVGSDQLGRTRDIGFYPNDPSIVVVDYPAAFGLRILGVPINLAGQGTFNDSVEVGTENAVRAARQAYDPTRQADDPSERAVVLNGYSQSAPVAYNAAYVLHGSGEIPDDDIIVLVGADSRFPVTGVENVVPSFIDGMYTNGDRDPADLGDIEVISYCVRGDATCGVGNPLAHPVSTVFYLVPGFYVHAFLNDEVNQFAVTKTWHSETGNTTYVVLDGGNPWGMMLRDLGAPVPRQVDDALSTLVPVPMPGERATIAGHPVPTPRELQDTAFAALGLDVPVTDPDAVQRRDATTLEVAGATMPTGAPSELPGVEVVRQRTSADVRPPRSAGLWTSLHPRRGTPVRTFDSPMGRRNHVLRKQSHESTAVTPAVGHVGLRPPVPAHSHQRSGQPSTSISVESRSSSVPVASPGNSPAHIPDAAVSGALR